jgi:hypothetical protein
VQFIRGSSYKGVEQEDLRGFVAHMSGMTNGHSNAWKLRVLIQHGIGHVKPIETPAGIGVITASFIKLKVLVRIPPYSSCKDIFAKSDAMDSRVEEPDSSLIALSLQGSLKKPAVYHRSGMSLVPSFAYSPKKDIILIIIYKPCLNYQFPTG